MNTPWFRSSFSITVQKPEFLEQITDSSARGGKVQGETGICFVLENKNSKNDWAMTKVTEASLQSFHGPNIGHFQHQNKNANAL